MATSAAARVRHLSLVRAHPVYDDRVPDGPFDRKHPEEPWWLPAPPTITPEPDAHERWLACDRPGERLRYGAYLCDCTTCWAAVERMVRMHNRPGLPIVIVTEADRIKTSARELLAQYKMGDGYRSLLWVVDDVVQRVYVGRGTTRETASEAHTHWQIRAAKEGKYLPRPRLEHHDAKDRHPASTAPSVSLSIRLPRSLERRAREVAAAGELDLETWIVEALQTATDA
jgi:hypothetical protein